ncbi:WAT1-related protein At4g30420 [Linum grandiflorum]
MEKVDIRSLRSNAKILGTVICVVGAMAMAFLKGPKLLNSQLLGSDNDWLMGCLLLFASSFLWSFWIILQVIRNIVIGKTAQSTMVTLFLEKDFSAWKLNSTFELGCCLYSGVTLALTILGQGWCVGQRGPVFPAIFDPLCTVITAIFASINRLIGAVLVIMGLYVVLWGKAKDMKESKNDKENISTNDLEEPFLCNKPTQNK